MQLMRVCVGLIFELSPGFLAFYWSAGFGTFLLVTALASHWLEDCETVPLRLHKIFILVVGPLKLFNSTAFAEFSSKIRARTRYLPKLKKR